MSEILVERHWEKPLTDDDMLALFAAAGGCLAIHRCEWRGSLLSGDGRELFCHFTAPDAESVRIALHEAGSPRGSIWPGTIHDAPGSNQAELESANVVVTRRFDEPVALADIQTIEDAGAGCLENHRVRFVRTYFSTDRRRMMCLYRAPDAESVRIAQREAGMPVERVWSFRQFRPE
jgi:hypothetical protein